MQSAITVVDFKLTAENYVSVYTMTYHIQVSYICTIIASRLVIYRSTRLTVNKKSMKLIASYNY